VITVKQAIPRLLALGAQHDAPQSYQPDSVYNVNHYGVALPSIMHSVTPFEDEIQNGEHSKKPQQYDWAA
jgi:hypothetical protein